MGIKVLHLSHTDIRSDSRILKELRAISSLGFELRAIGVELNENVVEDKNVSVFDIQSIRIKSKKLKFLPDFLLHLLTVLEIALKAFIKIVRFKPNIIHCHDVVVLPLGILCKLIIKSKVIYDAHELESDRNGLSKGLGKLTLFVEKLLWRYIDQLIVVSPSIANWYETNLGKKEIEIILNSPIYTKQECEDKKFNYLREYFHISDEKKIFLYVGILAQGRGIKELVEIFDSIDNVCLIFMGYGQYYDYLRKEAESRSYLYVHDAVAHHDVVPIVKSADFGVCLIHNVSLSDFYSLPNKLFEYAFSGVPMIASNFPDIKDVVEKYNLGVTCGLDNEDIKKSVMSLINGDYLFQDCKDIWELSWENQELKIQKLYKKLLWLD